MSTDQYVHIPVCLHVFLAVDTGLECLLTIWAHKGSDLAVRRHVTLQTSIGCKCAVADQAFVGFQTSVCPNVSLKNTTGYKRSSALKALKRFLPYEKKNIKCHQKWFYQLFLPYQNLSYNFMTFGENNLMFFHKYKLKDWNDKWIFLIVLLLGH